jgi:hypothetical protein
MVCILLVTYQAFFNVSLQETVTSGVSFIVDHLISSVEETFHQWCPNETFLKPLQPFIQHDEDPLHSSS